MPSGVQVCLYTSHTPFLDQPRIHVVRPPPSPLSLLCYSLAPSPPPLSRHLFFSLLTRLYNHALASPLRFRAFLGSTDIHGEFNSRVFTWNSCFDQRAPLLDAIESFAIHVNGNAAHRSCSWKMKAGGSAK